MVIYYEFLMNNIKNHNQISEMLIKENLADKVFVINGDIRDSVRTKFYTTDIVV